MLSCYDAGLVPPTLKLSPDQLQSQSQSQTSGWSSSSSALGSASASGIGPEEYMYFQEPSLRPPASSSSLAYYDSTTELYHKPVGAHVGEDMTVDHHQHYFQGQPQHLQQHLQQEHLRHLQQEQRYTNATGLESIPTPPEYPSEYLPDDFHVTCGDTNAYADVVDIKAGKGEGEDVAGGHLDDSLPDHDQDLNQGKRSTPTGLPTPNPPTSTSSSKPRPTTTRSFRMGYRSSCEKCRNRVPGHYSHFD